MNLNHLAIVMDGNGRWAQKHNLVRVAGHKKGAIAAKNVIFLCCKLNIKYLTLFAFSSENWQRPAEEVLALMKMFEYYISQNDQFLINNNIKVKFIGDIVSLSSKINDKIAKIEHLTANHNQLNLTIALNYGSKQEIVTAVKRIINDCQTGKLDASSLDEKTFANYLYTNNIPDPDLLIRTSGEQRLSNFLLWQMAYTEFYFSSTLWPDFCEQDLQEAIGAYNKRIRKYGTI